MSAIYQIRVFTPATALHGVRNGFETGRTIHPDFRLGLLQEKKKKHVPSTKQRSFDPFILDIIRLKIEGEKTSLPTRSKVLRNYDI